MPPAFGAAGVASPCPLGPRPASPGNTLPRACLPFLEVSLLPKMACESSGLTGPLPWPLYAWSPVAHHGTAPLPEMLQKRTPGIPPGLVFQPGSVMPTLPDL